MAKERIYPIFVNYDQSIEELVRLGKYVFSDNRIDTKHFPTNRVGKAEMEIKLIHFNRSILSKDAIEKMDKKGYRPAELHELLAFGEKYSDVQHKFSIIALGSVWQDSDGDRYFACLYKNKGDLGCHLLLSTVTHGWLKNCHFAAVRKSA